MYSEQEVSPISALILDFAWDFQICDVSKYSFHGVREYARVKIRSLTKVSIVQGHGPLVHHFGDF
jgi:hypothetical protein